MKRLNQLSELPYFGKKDCEGLSKEQVDYIRNLASVTKETITALNTIANIKTKDIFMARDIAKAAFRRYVDLI